MPTLKIDLATRILDDTMQVHLVHPGARYSFYDTILRDSVLPVDVPHLKIRDGASVPNADQIEPMLERARQMRRWAKRPASESGTPMPSRDVDYYRIGANFEASAQGARTRLRNAAQDILWGIPDGTLVAIPSKNITDMVIFAEMGDRAAPRVEIAGSGHYSRLGFLARPIRIVRTVPMLDLPLDVLTKVRSTSAIELIDGQAEDKMLRLAYGDYQRDSEFVAGVISNTEDFDALVLAQMIDLHIAIEHFIATGDVLKPGEGTWASRGASSPFLHATINSRNGRASLESRGMGTFVVKLLAIVAASGISLADAGALIAQGDLEVVNSKDSTGGGAIIAASENAVTDFFATSGYPTYNEYLEGLQNGLDRNATSPQGTAVIKP